MHVMTFDKQRNFIWTEVADPIRKPDEVLISVKAAALNRADLLQREGNYPAPPGWPEWPGLEVAGIIIEAPENSGFQPGMNVCALLGGGGYAEKIAVPVGMVLPVPNKVSITEAASIPEVFTTAWLNLVIEGGLKSGDTVFIQAGASGLGLASIQLVKLFGGKVITTVGSDDKAKFVQDLGADIIINHRKDNIVSVLQDNPVDIALDCVGGADLSQMLATMSSGGRWIVLATLGGAVTQIDLGLLFRKNIHLIGTSLRSRTTEQKAELLKSLQDNLWDKFASGQIKSVIHKILPIQEVEEAQRILRDRENIGKVVLTV